MEISSCSIYESSICRIKNLFIGKIYTPADLASYNKGEQFPSVLVMNINSAISSVLFPAMSIANQEKGKLKELTRQSIMMSSYVVFPIVTGLIIVAEPMIRLLLTDRWISCVPFYKLVAYFGCFSHLRQQMYKQLRRLEEVIYA